MYVCLYVMDGCMYVWMDVCMNVWMDACMDVRMHVCMHELQACMNCKHAFMH